GSVFAGLVYVILALVIKFCGSGWINKIMPPIIIGPVVALIGFDLASSAIAASSREYLLELSVMALPLESTV
ncbi:MAG: hypothetical protein J6Z28_05025, partial [Succinivibrio sp.]|nr:hypothetical protein [Succinivibrio sp.]